MASKKVDGDDEDMQETGMDELVWGVFGPVNACCGVTASVGHDLYCENRVRTT